MKTVFLKLTNYCTSFCKHCYIPIEKRKQFYILDIEKLDIVLKKIRNFFKNEWGLILHGGEILELELSYLEKVINVLIKNNINNISIQTSFLPLYNNNSKAKDFFKLVKKSNLNVSTSIDFNGIRKINNSEEIYLNFMKDIIRKFNEETSKKIISCDVIITKKNYGNNLFIYKYLSELKLYINHVDLGIYIPYPSLKKDLYISFYEYATELIKYYELDKKNNFLLFGDVFNGIKENIFNKDKNNYYFSCKNCINDYLVIEPNFDVTICIHENTVIGNIFNDNIIDILTNPKRKEWLRKNLKRLDFCKNCEFKNICEVCTVNKSIAEKLNIKTKENCPGFYPLLKYISNDILNTEKKDNL